MPYQYVKEVCLERLIQEIGLSAIVTALDTVLTSVLGNTVYIYFKADLSEGDVTILDALVAAHVPTPMPIVPNQVEVTNIITTPVEGAQITALTKLEGSSTLIISPNLCDKTTWFGPGSIHITDETLTTSDNLIFNSLHTFWIDLSHGKVPYEDRYVATYAPVIEVDNVAVTTGFSINYSTGVITFEASQEGHTVTASYYYANAMIWELTPDSGKILKILGTNVKFTDDAEVPSGQEIYFQAFVGTYPVSSKTTYKNMRDFVLCADRADRILKWGTEVLNDIIDLDFDYITSKDLKYSQGVKIKVWFKNNIPVEGTFVYIVATAISLTE